MWQGKVKILANKEIAPKYLRMALEAPQVASEARAGQFLHVKATVGYMPLLRRPLSVHRIRRKRVEARKNTSSAQYLTNQSLATFHWLVKVFPS